MNEVISMKPTELMQILQNKKIRFEYLIENNEELKKQVEVILMPFIAPNNSAEIMQELEKEEVSWGVNNGLYAFFPMD